MGSNHRTEKDKTIRFLTKNKNIITWTCYSTLNKNSVKTGIWFIFNAFGKEKNEIIPFSVLVSLCCYNKTPSAE